MRTLRLATAGASVLLFASALGACTKKPELPPFDGYDPASSYRPGGTQATVPPPPPVEACKPVKAEPLRGRKAIVGAGGSSGGGPNVRTVTRAQLWTEFAQSCATASCHGVNAARGQRPEPQLRSPAVFTVDDETFHERRDLGAIAIARILSPDPNAVMPPIPRVDGSKRPADDEFRLLGERLLAWEEAGFPDSFQIQDKEAAPTPRASAPSREDPYRLDSDLAAALTNIGSCLPDPKLERVMDEAMALDKVFAGAKTFDDLPATLAETDLVSLDSAVLAQRGVYSYAPTYTLFSDHASKMRYVRVPVGQKIKYNPATKDFDIPANTRFYKTFLRKVVDKNGEVGYRKMETRLIVSRPDHKRKDGSYEVRSLMVVYAWDKDERVARKVTDPLNRQEPWRDRLCPYVEDEQKPRTKEKNPISPQASRTCTYMTEQELADPSSGKVRHYGIPSKDRCVECHMGSTNHSFILGFTPWHVDRRKAGEGGVFEDPHEDELDQLQRLISYGVIEGIAPGQAKLEESQLPRKPRNDHELVAQGYMMGNCAFCHNETGFPVVENPILKEFLLFPGDKGGAFQFPLEKFSPRAKVGPEQTLRHPYITPALDDFHPDDGFTTPPKGDAKIRDSSLVDAVNDRDKLTGYDEFDTINGFLAFLGPWRSLIWRNTYTPFTYAEDNTVFIHMPRNVPGHDCRAQRIMADWMISIPSAPKPNSKQVVDPATGEVITPSLSGYRPGWVGPGVRGTSGHEQPYFEVHPGDRPFAMVSETELPFGFGQDYDHRKAVRDADERLAKFRASITAQHCPDEDDIVDPAVINATDATVKAPFDRGTMNGPRVNPAAQGTPVLKDNVPDHAHWVPVDVSDPPGQWSPRRKQWKQVLVDRDPAVPVSPKTKLVIDELVKLSLDFERETFSTELVPLGLWEQSCRDSAEASASKTLGELRGAESDALATRDLRPMHHWLFDRDPKLNLWWSKLRDNERVHSQSRGEAVFRAICINCHGKNLDSRSPLAATILELTGGETRVANFLDGIFGPAAAPGQYAENVFSTAGRGGTPADWLARYIVFMGMGGTEAFIPEIAVRLVSTSPFYGHAPTAGRGIADANMLESARSLCQDVMFTKLDVIAVKSGEKVSLEVQATEGLRGTGHFELWSSLCGFRNVPLVRAFRKVNPATAVELSPSFQGAYRIFGMPSVLAAPALFRAKDAAGRWVYPPARAVGTYGGRIERGVQPTNTLPWCVWPENAADRQAAVDHFRRSGIAREEDMPFCPAELLTDAFGLKVHLVPESGNASLDFVPGFMDAWTRTGAINAGVAAYYFLDGVTKGKLRPQTQFDECRVRN